MRVFFTGATGVLGREAVPLLVSSGHEVTSVVRGAEKARWARAMGSDPVEVDLFDAEALKVAVAGHDVIIHMATAIPPLARMAKREAWAFNDRLRARTTAHLVDAAIEHSVARFILQSVVFVYADGGDRWIGESSPVAPVWDVLDSALQAEAEAERFGNTGGDSVVLRFGRLYGPGAASAGMIEAVAAGRAPIVSDGENYVSSLHVADAATAIHAALTVHPGTYNVVDDEPVASAEILRTIAEQLGVKSPRRVPRWLASRAVGKATRLLTISHRVSNQHFSEVTGWRPRYPSVLEGLRSMLG